MLELSERLSAGFPHVRVDWYNIGGKPYFGEMTFYTGGGYDPFMLLRNSRMSWIESSENSLCCLREVAPI